jgi:hypothetical protein
MFSYTGIPKLEPRDFESEEDEEEEQVENEGQLHKTKLGL